MIAAFMVPQEPEKKPKYIECKAAYPLAKKICDAIDSEDFQRLNFGMRILDWIDDIPAADVRPVVQGKWEISEHEYIDCSVCGYAFYTGFDTTAEAKEYLESGYTPNYCPNCGAKMEES